jgi:hypothetical protein
MANMMILIDNGGTTILLPLSLTDWHAGIEVVGAAVAGQRHRTRCSAESESGKGGGAGPHRSISGYQMAWIGLPLGIPLSLTISHGSSQAKPL